MTSRTSRTSSRTTSSTTNRIAAGLTPRAFPAALLVTALLAASGAVLMSTPASAAAVTVRQLSAHPGDGDGQRPPHPPRARSATVLPAALPEAVRAGSVATPGVWWRTPGSA